MSTTTTTPPTIPIALPWLDEREAAAARRVILSGWVTQGPEVAAFERDFCEYVGAAHACAVSNCTTALHLALLAVGVKPGDEVITVSHSFIATANAIRYCGAKPVFVDIDPATFNMDPTRVEAAIGPKTKAILAVHQMGMPCDLRALLALARRRGLPLVEDAACAIGSEIQWDGHWEKIGKPHADLACFSFHPRKLVTTGDGGMITTNDAKIDAQLKLIRQHGMSVPDTVRHGAKQVIFESYPVLGYNYRMTDIQAAVGREQLKKLPEVITRRRTLASQYESLLAGEDRVAPPHQPEWARSNYQSYAVRLDNAFDQRAIMQDMLNQGVSTRRGIMNAHREDAYPRETWSGGPAHATCDCPAGTCAKLHESEVAQDKCILLPLFHQLTDDDQRRVVSALRKALDCK